MSKRSQQRIRNPDNPADWIGQPYVPRAFFSPLSRGRAPFYGFLIELVRRPSKHGCFLIFGLVGIIAVAWVALIAIGFIQTNGLGFWALLVLIGAAIIGTLAGTASARRRRETIEAKQHHHHKQR